MRLTLWQSDRCFALGGKLTLRRCFQGGDSDRATSLDSIWYGFRHQPLPMWYGHRRARTDVYCLPTPKDDYRKLAGSGDDPPQWIWRAAIGRLDSSAGQLGFKHQPLLTWTSRSRERAYALPSDAWIGNWVPRGMTPLMSLFAEHSSRAPTAAASLLLVALIVPAAPILSIGRLVEHQRRASEGEDPGGEGAVKCLAGHSARRTFVTVHKVKRRTGTIG